MAAMTTKTSLGIDAFGPPPPASREPPPAGTHILAPAGGWGWPANTKEPPGTLRFRGGSYAVTTVRRSCSHVVDGDCHARLAVGGLVLVNHASAGGLVELLGSDLVGGFGSGLIAGAFSLVSTRFFCDLMFATFSPNDVCYKDIQGVMLPRCSDKTDPVFRVSSGNCRR